MALSTYAVVLVLVAVATAAPQEWTAFKAEFGKEYATAAEEDMRLSVFQDNLRIIAEHNAANHSYTLGVNQFADLTNEEFRAKYLPTTFKPKAPEDRNEVYLPTDNLADSLDWRTKGAVTPVKNQGQCGSCWSFSTTGSVEGAYQIAKGKLVSLSEQQLMDCSTSFGNQGCSGGLMDDAFKYIIQNEGLDTEADYPYTARDGKCNTAKAAIHAANITSFKDVPTKDETQLRAAANIGPVSVAIEADQISFQLYKKGILSLLCGKNLDHGVLIVGYGTGESVFGQMDYWTVKNSWGASWGEDGYVRIERGKDMCGIQDAASYPIVA